VLTIYTTLNARVFDIQGLLDKPLSCHVGRVVKIRQFWCGKEPGLTKLAPRQKVRNELARSLSLTHSLFHRVFDIQGLLDKPKQSALLFDIQVIADATRTVPCKATWKREFKLPWRKAGLLKIISMIKWIRTSRLSIENSLSLHRTVVSAGGGTGVI